MVKPAILALIPNNPEPVDVNTADPDPDPVTVRTTAAVPTPPRATEKTGDTTTRSGRVSKPPLRLDLWKLVERTETEKKNNLDIKVQFGLKVYLKCWGKGKKKKVLIFEKG